METLRKTDKMTSLELAELTGKRHADILNSIKKQELAWFKVTQRNFTLSEYKDKTGRTLPMYEFTKSESLFVSTKFNDVARAKVVVRWEQLEREKQKPLSNLDMIQLSINAIRENQIELQEVKQDIKELKAITTTRPSYFTVAAFGTINNMPVNTSLASKIGRNASKICKNKGLLVDRIKDTRWGFVNSYPEDVLKEVFNTTYLK